MKLSSWLLGGVATAGVVGLIFLLLGLFKPGAAVLPEITGGSGKPLLAEAKKKLGDIRSEREKLTLGAKKISSFQGQEGEHRVFVSTQLVYLPGNPEPVQPLDRTMKTDDGIEVGWKIQFGFDPTDPAVAEEDPDRDGFTNLEEFVAGTDPGRKEDSPAKESKLRARVGNPTPMAVSFSEKGGGTFTVRFQIGAKRKEFKGKPGDQFWIMAGADSLEIFSDEAKARAAQAKAKEGGLCEHVIPIKITGYLEKVEKVKDASTGGLEIEADNSELSLEREDALKGSTKLLFSTLQRPRSVIWDTGDIRLFSPILGGNGIGPFRLGQTFSFEDKKFAVVGREGQKVQLRNLAEAGEKTFWVPPDTSVVPHAPAP